MKVIVWEHKHGSNLYDASTEEIMQLSALEILRDLIHNQYIYPPEDPMKNLQYTNIDWEQANLTDEQIHALPTASMREEATKHKNNLARRLSNYQAELEDWNQLQRMLAGEKIVAPDWHRKADSPDGKFKAGDLMKGRETTPWMMVQQWGDGEYTQFSLESVWSPKEATV